MPLRSLALDHRGLLSLLMLHALAFAAIVGVGSPFATASVECAAAVAVDAALGRVDWPLLQTWDGLLGGMGFGALAGLPVFALLGMGGLATKVAAYVGALSVLVVVYLLLDRHALPFPRARRRAALLAVAILAFGPPALLHPQLTLGNWHWSQLLFDYGVALLALEALARERARGARASLLVLLWLALGLTTGVGVASSLGSLPFLATAWGGLALLLPRVLGWRRAAMRLVGAGCAAVVGLTPLLLKATLPPYGRPGRPDQTLGRLSRMEFDPRSLLDLIGAPLADGLGFSDVLPGPPSLVFGGPWLAVVWVLALAGAVALARAAVRARRSMDGQPLGAWVPLAYLLAYAAVHVVIDTGVGPGLPEFSNLRDPIPRQIPPLLVALGLCAAVGAAVIAERGGLARGALLVAGVLPLLGAVGMGGMVFHAGQPAGSVSSYRGACLDVTGFFASPHFDGEPLVLQARCAAQPDASAARACAAGAAWGLGYYGLAFAADDALPRPWPAGQPGLAQSAADRCEVLPVHLQSRCLLGLGWHVGQLDWGRARWPLSACNALSAEDQGPCWRGVGFQAGDHLHPQPHKLGQAITRVPPRRRADVARGMGYSIGRTYADRALPDALCAAAGLLVEAGCRRGVDDALRDR